MPISFSICSNLSNSLMDDVFVMSAGYMLFSSVRSAALSWSVSSAAEYSRGVMASNEDRLADAIALIQRTRRENEA